MDNNKKVGKILEFNPNIKERPPKSVSGKAKIIDISKGINSLGELSNYLENHFTTGPRLRHNFYSILEDDSIIGVYGSTQFMINYEPGKRATIAVDQGAEQTLKELEILIAPLMWIKTEDKFCAPIVKYDINDVTILEWELERPEDKVKSVALDYYMRGSSAKNIQSLHPKYKMENYVDDVLYGNYDGFFPDELIDSVQKFTECELFNNIVAVISEEKELDMQGCSEDDEDYVVNNFNLSYLLRQTERFGIKSEPAGIEPLNFTREQLAWIRWWMTAFENYRQEMASKGISSVVIDKDFKPRGSYTEYLDEFPEEMFENFEECEAQERE